MLWSAGVDTHCASLVISTELARKLELEILPLNLSYRTAASGKELLRAQGLANMTFDLEDSASNWRQYREQVVVADISSDMLLGMSWLKRHSPTVKFDPPGLYHPRTIDDPLARIEPVSLDELCKDGKPIYIAALRVDDEFYPDDGLLIPEPYRDLVEAFSPDKAWQLPPHREGIDLAIDLEPDAKLSLRPLYRLSEYELEILREYINECLQAGFIRPSKAATGAPVLFAPKKDGGLRMCTDYRELNSKSLKNRYPLPLIDDILHRLAGAKIFTALDLKNAYHRIRIREGDEWKTAFRTQLGAFEYQVVPFGLTNAPAAFQSYINQTLREYLDVFVVAYLDDLVIYSKREEDHEEHVRLVLKALMDAGLYCKLSKCTFSAREIELLGYVVSDKGVSMSKSRLNPILDWPEPRSIKDIQQFIGFANFYRRFVPKFSKIALGMTNMLRGGKNNQKKVRKLVTPIDPNTPNDFLTEEARASFYSLKEAFADAVSTHHFNPNRKTKIETDASGFAISGILSQLDESTGNWVPVAFYSRKMDKHELNYGIHDQELLAIVESFSEWRHYLEGSKLPVTVFTDHDSLLYFSTTTKLNRRQVRWAQKLSAFWFCIKYQEGSKNPADAPSRRPDYEREAANDDSGHTYARELADILSPDKENRPAVWSLQPGDDGHQLHESSSVRHYTHGTLASLLASGTSQHERYEPEIREAPDLVRDEDPYGTPDRGNANDGISLTLKHELPQMLLQDETAVRIREGLRSKPNRFKGWADVDGLLWYKSRLYIPENESLRRELVRRHHDLPLAGHFADKRTSELLGRKYYWKGMHKYVEGYCRACGVCQGSRVLRGKMQGELQPLEAPMKPWDHISMDFITDLPTSISFDGVEYNSIFVVVDRFTKMAHFIPTWKDITTEQLADTFIREIVRLHGLPSRIVSDRGSVFANEFWGDLLHILKIARDMSTAYHPQSDGQTERLNSVLEQYLRSYINFDQDDWVKWLPLAEFAYNNSRHSSTGDTPFRLLFGLDPRMDFMETDASGVVDPNALEGARSLEERRDRAREALVKAREYQKAYYDKSHRPTTFQEGDLVWLDLRNVKTSRPSKKLDIRRWGPCKVLAKVGSQAYRIELPAGLNIHNVFHVSLLRKHQSMDGVESNAHHQVRLADPDEREFQVEKIIDSEMRGRQIWYRTHWQGYDDDEEKTWVPVRNVRHLRKKLMEYHRANPNKPGIRNYVEATRGREQG
jgi:transposase InsO family protein